MELCTAMMVRFIHVALGEVRPHIAILLLLYPTGFSFSMWWAVTYLLLLCYDKQSM